MGSAQVSWWDVRTFVTPILEAAGSWPLAGTPEWCALDDTDPVKVAALFDAAQHWSLRVETCQQARAETSRDISSAADWSAIAAQIYNRAQLYAERPWLKRASA
jgi:hypothetical protein